MSVKGLWPFQAAGGLLKRYNGVMRVLRPSILTFLTIIVMMSTAVSQAQETDQVHVVQPGDTWVALGLRYTLDPAELQSRQGSLNRTSQPPIGSTIVVESGKKIQEGVIVRPDQGGLLEVAVLADRSPWEIATLNHFRSPYSPPHGEAFLLPVPGTEPRDLPVSINSMMLSASPALPGEAIAIYLAPEIAEQPVIVELDGQQMAMTQAGNQLVALGSTSAFHLPGPVELRILVGGKAAWSQPWLFANKEWIYQNLNLTGEAAAIDQDSITAERQRLNAIWSVNSAAPIWTGPFAEPIQDFLEVSAPFGARRSYNGGPYRSFHEGTDYSAFRGTPVFSAAKGKVVLAEQLYVRGGAILIDHGASIFTGYYHLSAVHVVPGQDVEQGELIGEVGTSGLSTGNHLHWDLLVNGGWVDARAFLEQDLACQVLDGLGRSCDTVIE